MTNRVTLWEVAAKAGVSASTVCRALRSDPQISLKTRDRVREVAESLGYRPDPLLSAFALRRRGRVKGSEASTLAFITNFPTATGWRSHPYYGRCYEGALGRADHLGYKLEHFWLREPGMNAERLSRVLYNRGIFGICLPPSPQVRGHLSLNWPHFAAVTIGYSLMRPAMNRVSPHHFHGILFVLRELRRRGYRRMGLCLYARTGKRADDLWLAGARVFQDMNPDIHCPVFLMEDRSLERAPKWCKKERLEVIVACEEMVVPQLRKTGITMPGQVDFATVAWSPEAPEYSGVDQRPDAIGSAAIDIVIAQLQRGELGLPAIPITSMVEGRWMEGTSLTRGSSVTSEVD